jgi:hypothetical protein
MVGRGPRSADAEFSNASSSVNAHLAGPPRVLLAAAMNLCACGKAPRVPHPSGHGPGAKLAMAAALSA